MTVKIKLARMFTEVCYQSSFAAVEVYFELSENHWKEMATWKAEKMLSKSKSKNVIRVEIVL